MARNKFSGPSLVFFQGKAPSHHAEAGLRVLSDQLFGRKIEDVKSEWKTLSKHLQEMVDGLTANKPTGFHVEDITIELGFSAEGKLAFIAQVGVQASVAVTFKPSPQTSTALRMTNSGTGKVRVKRNLHEMPSM